MASCMSLIGSFIVLFALLMGATEGTEYTVGDSLGWTIPPNIYYYSNWASTKDFFVGDTLIFKWTGNHTVGDVTKRDYDRCNAKASASGVNQTELHVNLSRPGPRYFICTVDHHCLMGMKFSINVVEPRNDAAALATPPGSSATTLSFTVFGRRI